MLGQSEIVIFFYICTYVLIHQIATLLYLKDFFFFTLDIQNLRALCASYTFSAYIEKNMRQHLFSQTRYGLLFHSFWIYLFISWNFSTDTLFYRPDYVTENLMMNIACSLCSWVIFSVNVFDANVSALTISWNAR